MTNGWTLLGIASLICVAAFLNGLRFSRFSNEKVAAGRLQIEMPSWLARGRSSGEQVRLIGRIQMIAAPVMLLFFIVLTFGLLGPIDGIQTIKF